MKIHSSRNVNQAIDLIIAKGGQYLKNQHIKLKASQYSHRSTQ